MKYPGVKALTFRGFPTDEPTLPLETFDVSASDFDDLVEKLT